MNKPLRGVIPPVATPFKDEELDLKALQANLRTWNQTGLSGYLILGSNGESCYLSEAEKEAVLAAAAEAMAPDKLFMAGTGCESTRQTIGLTRRASELGADCALVLTPAYYKGQMTNEALEAHYQKVAEASPMPILLYNVPQFTGVNLAPALVARLSAHDNIAGIKDSSGNIGQLTEIIRQSRPGFAVFVGSAPVFYPALCVGAVGGILAVANVVPELCVELQRLYQAGGHPGALAMQRAINPLAALVTTGLGVGGLKLAMDLRGFQGGQVRSPLCLPQAARPQLAQELDKLRPLL
ncbi:MAG: dihydrodipicolinate synthase family protein [Desulfarculus sp.]|nr:dihydrodipicolinate synthase family protein [Desulfarculus sp.]